MNNTPIAVALKKARKIKGLTQKEFGNEIKKSQGVVSKYERGIVSPSAEIYNHCMNIIDSNNPGFEVDEIIKKIKANLSGPEHSDARRLLVDVIDYVTLSRTNILFEEK